MAKHRRPIADVIQQAITLSYTRYRANEGGVVAGHDAEAVHQARVATRRLRSDLLTFEQFVDEKWAKGLRAELRWLGADLGAVRDIEVMKERLTEHTLELPAVDADAVNRALRRLDADRYAARDTLLASMHTPRYAELMAALADAADQPRLTQAARRPARNALAKVVHQRWKKLKKGVDGLGPVPSDEALHAIRIRAKRCRYAAEACAPVLGKNARRFAREMENVQEVLGLHHDAVVSAAWLAKTAHECPSGQAYALGRLAQIEHAVALDTRNEFFDVWPAAAHKRLRDWS